MSLYYLYESVTLSIPLLSFHCFLPQNDLTVLFTSLADSKYTILQRLANVFEQPIVEQIQVCTTVPDTGMYKYVPEELWDSTCPLTD